MSFVFISLLLGRKAAARGLEVVFIVNDVLDTWDSTSRYSRGSNKRGKNGGVFAEAPSIKKFQVRPWGVRTGTDWLANQVLPRKARSSAREAY
jgi:hypothetical protein